MGFFMTRTTQSLPVRSINGIVKIISIYMVCVYMYIRITFLTVFTMNFYRSRNIKNWAFSTIPISIFRCKNFTFEFIRNSISSVVTDSRTIFTRKFSRLTDIIMFFTKVTCQCNFVFIPRYLTFSKWFSSHNGYIVYV